MELVIRTVARVHTAANSNLSVFNPLPRGFKHENSFIIFKIGDRLSRWIQHFESGEIPPVKAAVAREQPIGRTQGMRTD